MVFFRHGQTLPPIFFHDPFQLELKRRMDFFPERLAAILLSFNSPPNMIMHAKHQILKKNFRNKKTPHHHVFLWERRRLQFNRHFSSGGAPPKPDGQSVGQGDWAVKSSYLELEEQQTANPLADIPIFPKKWNFYGEEKTIYKIGIHSNYHGSWNDPCTTGQHFWPGVDVCAPLFGWRYKDIAKNQ